MEQSPKNKKKLKSIEKKVDVKEEAKVKEAITKVMKELFYGNLNREYMLRKYENEIMERDNPSNIIYCPMCGNRVKKVG